ncbi:MULTISPECIES: MarR family winged helix-turn-helix transcriptional regulator [Culturomica]|jgi:DNA-binding MarR family transcriptional regulator|uniref:MarR family winged helix-turn-helix transcriptional regulator n=1 Tax=Culturomica TaxID=1926651 RepID=UPI000340A7B4|nr:MULTISPECIES: MarR family transcriptional regulator [Odoribacteraceae]RHV93183.1 MarR family transcriptional regulator [Odoribacter sp. OF09-27XD]CCZ06160.1 regulatory protein MarR [Odoribacter sp. CAG:788]HBO26048.1 MarR family transcriptional regulator [Culturomica sp.]
MNDVRELVSYLSRAERGYTKVLNRAFQKAGYDLSREQFELLQVLWEEDNVNQQTISRRLQKDKYNVTKLLNTLTKRGFVQRKMSQEDRRNNFVVLTEKGQEARKALIGVEEQVHADLTFTIAPQEIKSCVWVLRKLTDLMN